MCGIAGYFGSADLDLMEGGVRAAREAMAHRGPDGAGLWRGAGVVLGHRRLAVIDPVGGVQPKVSACGRCAIVYNGMLYNDGPLRDQLRALGHTFQTQCDTETLLAALMQWGRGALPRLRGMYAFAFYDGREAGPDGRGGTLLLARDPLGVKPLYACALGAGVAFASEIRAILRMPGVRRRPDKASVSAYLTSIRTTHASRTLFEGVETLEPGESRLYRSGQASAQRTDQAIEPCAPPAGTDNIRSVVEESVRVHLRADAPVCTLLSGGLDSSIIAACVANDGRRLTAYVSGAESDENSDLLAAGRLAGELGIELKGCPVTRGLFAGRWAEMVARTGLPLSTPNEVAINELARTIRADGGVVVLSGEGADELFGGYESAVQRAIALAASPVGEPWAVETAAAAWTPLDLKAKILTDAVLAETAGDEMLVEAHRSQWRRVARACEDTLGARVAHHLRYHRRVNLAGLLLRLDQAAMLESVEGRTPFSDVAVAGVAESIPAVALVGELSALGCSPKRALREAFDGVVPDWVIRRPKASFPLPFIDWMPDAAGALRTSRFAREVFRAEAIELVAERPSEYWRLAWPMINVAMWGDAVGF